MAVSLQFTSPGDDIDSNDLVAEYVFKYSSTVGNLTEENFDSEEFNSKITAEDLTDSSLDPVMGGETKVIVLKKSIFEPNKKYVLAMKSRDDSDNWSPVSNKVTIFFPSAPTSTTAPAATRHPDLPTSEEQQVQDPLLPRHLTPSLQTRPHRLVRDP